MFLNNGQTCKKRKKKTVTEMVCIGSSLHLQLRTRKNVHQPVGVLTHVTGCCMPLDTDVMFGLLS